MERLSPIIRKTREILYPKEIHFCATAILSARVGSFFLTDHEGWRFPGLFRPIVSLTTRFPAPFSCNQGEYRYRLFPALLFAGRRCRIFYSILPNGRPGFRATSCLLATIEALPVSRVSFTICILISGEYCFLVN